MSFLIVLGLAIIELWLAIPTGFIMGLDPILISIASIAGTMVGVLIAYKLTKRIRQWIIERYLYRGEQKPKSRLYRIWQKYGIIGLGLLAPLFTGAPIGTAIGLTFDAPRGRLLVWITIGVVVWGVGLTLAGGLGILVFKEITG